MCLGLLSHCRVCITKSGACWQHSALSSIMMSRSELGVPGDQVYNTMHRRHTYYSRVLLRLLDQGVTEDRGVQTKTEAKTEDRTSTNFCHQAHSSLSMKTITIVLQSQALVFCLRV